MCADTVVIDSYKSSEALLNTWQLSVITYFPNQCPRDTAAAMQNLPVGCSSGTFRLGKVGNSCLLYSSLTTLKEPSSVWLFCPSILGDNWAVAQEQPCRQPTR